VALPTGSNGLRKAVMFPPGVQDPASECNFATYVAKGHDLDFPGYIPAAFSVKLGAGADSQSVAPYVAVGAVPSDVTLGFNGGGTKNGFFGCCCIQKFSGESAALGNFANFNDFAGSLPVGDVVACSSSFLGDFALLPSDGGSDPFTQLAAFVKGDLSTWAGAAPHADGLAKAVDIVNKIYDSKSVSEDNFNALVPISVRCSIDGGFTDVTGIAHAVAAGANDLVVVLNMTNTDVPDELFNLFADNAGLSGATADHRYTWKYRFNSDSTVDEVDGMSARSADAIFPIFKQDKLQAKAQYSAIKTHGTLAIPEGSDTQLVSMVAGVLHATTTGQRFFGVTPNKSVKMQIIAVNTKLNEGEVVDFHDYSTLVQEIVTTLLSPANRLAVSNTILPFFYRQTMPIGMSPDAEAKANAIYGGA